MDVKDVLVEARALVEQGWAKGYYTDGLGSYCVAGAINLAAGEMRDLNGAIVYAPHNMATKKLALIARLTACDHLPQPFESLQIFNDDPDTTKADVLAVLEKAIASC